MISDLNKQMDETFPCDLDNLRIVEILMGNKLPKDYRLFLQQVNGGVPSNRVFYSTSKPEIGSLLSILFGITKDEDKNIVLAYKRCKGSIPGDMIPIGCDQGGNDLLLCIMGKNYGKIYFLDHEQPITHVADSFEEFINNLKSEEEIEELENL